MRARAPKKPQSLATLTRENERADVCPSHMIPFDLAEPKILPLCIEYLKALSCDNPCLSLVAAQCAALECQVLATKPRFVVTDKFHAIPCEFTRNALAKAKAKRGCGGLKLHSLKGGCVVLEGYILHCTLKEDMPTDIHFVVTTFAPSGNSHSFTAPTQIRTVLETEELAPFVEMVHSYNQSVRTAALKAPEAGHGDSDPNIANKHKTSSEGLLKEIVDAGVNDMLEPGDKLLLYGNVEQEEMNIEAEIPKLAPSSTLPYSGTTSATVPGPPSIPSINAEEAAGNLSGPQLESTKSAGPPGLGNVAGKETKGGIPKSLDDTKAKKATLDPEVQHQLEQDIAKEMHNESKLEANNSQKAAVAIKEDNGGKKEPMADVQNPVAGKNDPMEPEDMDLAILKEIEANFDKFQQRANSKNTTSRPKEVQSTLDLSQGKKLGTTDVQKALMSLLVDPSQNNMSSKAGVGTGACTGSRIGLEDKTTLGALHNHGQTEGKKNVNKVQCIRELKESLGTQDCRMTEEEICRFLDWKLLTTSRATTKTDIADTVNVIQSSSLKVRIDIVQEKPTFETPFESPRHRKRPSSEVTSIFLSKLRK